MICRVSAIPSRKPDLSGQIRRVLVDPMQMCFFPPAFHRCAECVPCYRDLHRVASAYLPRERHAGGFTIAAILLIKGHLAAWSEAKGITALPATHPKVDQMILAHEW